MAPAVFFWIQIYGLIFAMGVATGIVQEFEFGMNWADYSRFVGNVFGSLLAAEGVFAFFLEGGFLGPDALWRQSTGAPAVAVLDLHGRLRGALQRPLDPDGQLLDADARRATKSSRPAAASAVMTDFWEVIFTPSFIPRLHARLGGLLDGGAALMLSVSAWYILKKRHIELAKANFKMALLPSPCSPHQPLPVRGQHGHRGDQQQPLKLASMEGLCESESCARMFLVGWVDEATRPRAASASRACSASSHTRTSTPRCRHQFVCPGPDPAGQPRSRSITL